MLIIVFHPLQNPKIMYQKFLSFEEFILSSEFKQDLEVLINCNPNPTCYYDLSLRELYEFYVEAWNDWKKDSQTIKY